MSNVKKGHSKNHEMIQGLFDHVIGVMEDLRRFPHYFMFPETDKLSYFHTCMRRDAIFYEISEQLKALMIQANDLHDNGNDEAGQKILN
eukprot:2970661-Rhodomonas_salina.1